MFTSSRSADELSAKFTIFCDLHPEFLIGDADRYLIFDPEGDTEPPDSRFIRVDAEANYTSTEFLHCAATYRYKLERTPPRDKHANGIVERPVGLVTLKTNVIMLTPTPPVPLHFWDLAMAYACDTLSFCFSKSINTSPYHLEHKAHVPFQYLQPFWTPCYVHYGQKN